MKEIHQLFLRFCDLDKEHMKKTILTNLSYDLWPLINDPRVPFYFDGMYNNEKTIYLGYIDKRKRIRRGMALTHKTMEVLKLLLGENNG